MSGDSVGGGLWVVEVGDGEVCGDCRGFGRR